MRFGFVRLLYDETRIQATTPSSSACTLAQKYRPGNAPKSKRLPSDPRGMLARFLKLLVLWMAITQVREERQSISRFLTEASAALFTPRQTGPASPEVLEAARERYHDARAAYMLTPSAPGTAEERAFQVAFEALDRARFGSPEPSPAPSPQLRAAAARAARLRAIMAGHLEPEKPAPPATGRTRVLRLSPMLRAS
jgi:hypothetical protein